MTEVAPDLAGTPGLPAVGELVWGIWGHRSEAVVPAAQLLGHALPAGLDPLAGAFARVGAIALERRARRGHPPRRGRRRLRPGRDRPARHPARVAQRRAGRGRATRIGSRLAKAREYGATDAVDARTGEVAERIRALTDGRGADVAIEISGAYPALHEAMRSVAVGGRVVASGFYQGDGDRPAARRGVPPQPRRSWSARRSAGCPPQLAGRWSVDRLQRTFLRLVARGRRRPGEPW